MNKKIAVITGGSSGIGSQIVKKYCDEGYIVYSTYNHSKLRADALEKSYIDNLFFYKVNLVNNDSIINFFDQIRIKHGRIDCLINNAGVAYPSTFEDLDTNSWIKTFSVNVFAPFLCIKCAKPLLSKSNNAAIVNISSMRGLLGCGGTDVIDYSASKAALINLTQTLAKEFNNITVNVIAPGFVATENSGELPNVMKNAAIENTLIRRFIEMREIADLCFFLTSRSARAITGTILPIDGGYSLIKL